MDNAYVGRVNREGAPKAVTGEEKENFQANAIKELQFLWSSLSPGTVALEFMRELGQNSWAPPGITRGKGTETIYQRHTEVWHISSSTVPAIPTSAQFAFPNRSTRPLSNSGTRCLTVAQATFPAASGIEFGAHVYITAFANSNQTELTLLVTVYRILIIISYSEGLHRAVKCRRPWCGLPVNTWTQKANCGYVTVTPNTCISLWKKSKQILISFNVSIYTYTVTELLDTVFLHFHSPRLQKWKLNYILELIF